MKKALFPSQPRLQQAVLNALATLGGEASPSSLYPLVTAYFDGELTNEALAAKLKRGDNKWENYIRWQREHLLKSGHISAPMRGIWSLTPFGRSCLGMGLLDSQDFSEVQPEEGMAMIPSSTQGFMLSAHSRKLIEMYAVDRAIKHFKDEGYAVETHGKPFDLLCEKNGMILYVEVKGTLGDANGLILTNNEVGLSQKNPSKFVLFVVSCIKVDNETEELSGGDVRVIHPWQPKEELLKVIAYTYDLSKHLS